MIKVLHVLSDSNIGGAGKYVEAFLRSYNKAELEPELAVPNNAAIVRLVNDIGIKVIEALIKPERSLDFRSIFVLRGIIKKGGYDLVHTHGSASARIAARGLCKTVFTKHTLSCVESGFKGFFRRIIYNLPGGFAIAVSQSSCRNLLQLGMKSSKIYIVTNGVMDMGVPSSEQKLKAKHSFNIEGSEKVIGIVARLCEIKDIPTFLSAAKMAADTIANLRFLICGDGSCMRMLMRMAVELKIDHRCIFTGRLENMTTAYHAMDVFCMTSKSECFGLSLAEAASSGLPAVLTRAEGLCEVALENETALFADIGDAKGISDGIVTLISNDVLAHRMGSAARQRYERKYTMEKFAYALNETYKKIIAEV